MRIVILALFGFGAAGALAALEKGNDSDLVKQWVVCQYVNSGKNPYSLAKDVLFATYGVENPERTKVHTIPKELPPMERSGEVLSDIGPPESTYPPSAIGMLACSLGLLAEPIHVIWVGLVLNLAAAGLVVIGLTRLWPVPPGSVGPAQNSWFVLAALLLFSPTFVTLEWCQFSLLVLGLLLFAQDSRWPWALRGLALGVALLKPSITLPFFFLFLVRREWRVMLTAVLVQAAGAAYVALQTGATLSLFTDWLIVARYFLHGMYTLQEWLNAANFTNPRLVSGISLSLLAFCGMTLMLARRLPPSRLFGIAAVTSVFWTYHGSYDFVVLLPVLLPLAGWSTQKPGRPWSLIGLTLFAVLTLALTTWVVRGDDLGTRSLRWVARLLVMGLFSWEYLSAYWSIFHLSRQRQEPTQEKWVGAAVAPAPSISG